MFELWDSNGESKTMKRFISIVILVIILAANVLAFLPQTTHAAASWYDSAWLYRKAFTLTGSASGAQTNYQIKLTTGYAVGADSGFALFLDSKSQVDFDDLRFTNSTGTVLLDAWLESKTDSSTATIWVELDSIPASPSTAIFYIYYGNPTAASNWSGVNTFPFFDGFDGAAINTTLWTVTGVCTEAGGIAIIPSGGILVGKTNFGVNYRFRGLIAYADNAHSALFGFYNNTAPTNFTVFGANLPTGSVLNSYNYASSVATSANLGNVGHNAYNLWDIERNSATSDIYILNGNVVSTLATNVPTVSIAAGFYAVGIAIGIDWVFIAKYVNPEPTISAWATVEVQPTPNRGLAYNNSVLEYLCSIL
jgi:hypothetical protein